MSTKKPNNSASAPVVKPFADHLGELRTRLAWVALVFIVASALAYNVREQLVSIVLSPIGHQKLVYLTPAGGFTFIFQISMYAGMLVTAPIAIYHLYKFVSPALPGHMSRLSVRMMFISTLLLSLGVSFGYFVAIPAALQFLTTFGGDFVTANLTADSYLSFVVAYLLGLGLLFQLPLLLVLWNWIQPFKPGGLLATQRFVLVGSFIAAAMITPTPDALNQCLIAIPIIAIYQLGVVAVFFMNRRARRRAPITVASRSHHGAPGALRELLEPTEHVTVSARVSAQAVFAPVPVTMPQLVRPQQRPRGAVDGFTRVRSNSVGVPGRQPVRVQASTRRSPNRSARSPVSVRRASVDGFGFVS